ncbi:hypothetical protein AB0F81_37200 [Actinoplanes sp. NPDC024001]|uniref:hypothetical protein n=1 Tax=Actinoplanes sp. NPDC024001 TaxID=3154598 RepID=UPI00340A8948
MTSSPLERRYRRLLRIYPARHRAAYEEEMIGVLMDGSAPGRRIPAPAEVADLLRAGLAARVGGSWRGVRGSGWRDASAVAGLIIAVMLAAVAGRRLFVGIHVIHVDPGGSADALGLRALLLLDVSLRFVLWGAVCAAALLGLRRAAAWLTLPAALVELGTVIWWLPGTPMQSAIRLSWSVVTVGVAIAALMAARRGRPLPVLLGHRGLGVVLVAAGGAVAAEVLADYLLLSYGWAVRIFELALFVLVAAIVLSAAPGVRGRAAVLLVPAFTGPITWELAQGAHLLTVVDSGRDLIAPFFVVLATPALAFGVALVVLWAWSVSRTEGAAKEQGHE